MLSYKPILAQVGAALSAGLLTFGLSGTAFAGELTPMMLEAGIGQDGCSGVFGVLVEFDSMLFDAKTPACSGFGSFDIAFLAVVSLIIISAIRFRHATTRRRLDLARRMVEKGLEPPPELVGAQVGNDLRRGLVLVSTGVGLLLASMLGGDRSLSPAGLIPGFIGLGYLVSHRFAVSKPKPIDDRAGGRDGGSR
ncbi:MAG: hypothetical protein KC431_03910 [Myxococcales bacterium]|nr:hypothetical protein [Myxococcales bacterium]